MNKIIMGAIVVIACIMVIVGMVKTILKYVESEDLTIIILPISGIILFILAVTAIALN
jgi:hypothetical protein